MSIRFIKAGILTTVQDGGRWQHLHQGVPVSGPMDELSARVANISLGNDSHDPILEFTQANIAFETLKAVLVAFSGAGKVRADGLNLPMNTPVFVPAGVEIAVEDNGTGCRTYFAVAGGWDVPEVLGSKSTCLVAGFGGYNGRKLKAGDILHSSPTKTTLTTHLIKKLQGDTIKFPSWSVGKHLFLPANDAATVRFVKGKEHDWFTAASWKHFLKGDYAFSKIGNRIGQVLEGPVMERNFQKELISTAVTAGNIQVTNDGSLILLMSDCQTTGGYPRLARVIAVDLPVCAQIRPGHTISFKEVSAFEAEKLYIYREKELTKLQLAIHELYRSQL